MFRFLCFACFIFMMSVSSANAQKKEKSKCEMWVTFYNVDKGENQDGFNVIANYIRENSNFLIVGDSNSGLKRFHNFCIDIVDDNVQKEFDAVSEIVRGQKQTGFVVIETKIGAKLTRL